MKKQTRKKLTAWLLSIAMVFSMVLEVLPAAYADGESASAPVTDWDFGDSAVTGRPRLFVDFLGDNGQYKAVSTEANNPGGLLTPGTEDQSAVTNPGLATNTWRGYSQADTVSGETIFWVGVGIDNMNLLDLFHQSPKDEGVYSAELGFYYDSTIIEPYTGPNNNYLEVIRAANLENYAHKWGDQYSIVAAESGLSPQQVLEPQVDPVTQEVISQPSVAQIVGDSIPNHPTSDWKMTYVSLEKTGDGLNRFHGEAQKDPPETGTQYIMLIPFRLKGYNGQYDHRSVGERDRYVCLRLIRNASLFSIGGGPEGVEPYGAWERVTTRNPGKDLKLMVNFQGDLDIFGGRRYLEDPYHANLIIEGNYVGTGNLAELSVTGDPSPNKGKVSTSGARINGLYGGTGMTLDVTCQSIYSVEVWVCPEGDTTKATLYPLGRVDENDILSHYTFLMPEGNVDVHVFFTLDPDVTDFWLYLNEKQEPDDQGRTVTGNSTVITATYTPAPNPDGSPNPDVVTVVDKDSPTNNFLGLPAAQVHMGAAVEIEIKVHKDYEAYVEVVNVHNGKRIALDDLPADHVPDTDTPTDTDRHLAVTLPTGGTITVQGGMPQSDMEVRVTYRPATRYRATLEVWHSNGTTVLPANVAQLESVVYSPSDDPMTSYSGVVYDDDTVTPENHSAVEQDRTGAFRVLGKVDASSAALSGSLGGDGRTPIGWNDNGKSIMAVAWQAATAADMADQIAPLDLRGQAVQGTAAGANYTGLRKNTAGEFYTDSDISDFYDRLYEIAQLARADGSYRVDKPDPADATLTYTYFDLSTAQVQMYLLDYEEYAKALAGGGTPAAPVLRTKADAAVQLDAQLAAHPWPAPSAASVPRTANDTPYLDVRGGRRVVVTLESDSVYTTLATNGVRLLTADGTRTLIATVQPQRDPDYQNVYYFDMPAQDCIVEVTYAERPVHDLGLTIEGDGGEPGNSVRVTGYVPDSPNITAKAETITKDKEHITNVLEGSTVTVNVKVAAGYEVWVEVVRGTGTGQLPVYSLPVTAVDANFTFVMPAQDSEVQVHYQETDKKRNNANIVLSYYPGTPADSSNQAWWDGTSPHATRKVSVEGEELTADLMIAKNYYIYAVRTYTTSEDNMHGPYIGAGYPFLLSGNGWNNGHATQVPLTLDTVMPDAEYWVEVILREGPPPREDDPDPKPEPEQSLTLQVKDEQNDTAPYDDNWASAQVVGGAALGPVGKARTSAYDTDYAMAGDTVTVEFHPAAGYYVESVEVLPASLGVAVVWTSATTAEFTMPAGSAAVVVTFGKGTGSSTRLFLDLAKTENGVPTEAGTSDLNNINYFRSPVTKENTGLIDGKYTVGNLPGRYPSGESTTGAARPGETVELEINVDAGWYIHSLSVAGSSGRLPYRLYSTYDPNTNTGTPYNAQTDYNAGAATKVTATFVMPHSDAAVVVNYRQGEPPDKQTDYVLELRVSDPENTETPFADNYAQAQVAGSALGPVGKARTPDQLWDMDYVREGDTVSISYGVADGYALDVIIVSSNGQRVPVTYSGGSAESGDPKTVALFTMPAGDVTALVRFKKGEPNKYTANLVLHMPDSLLDGTPLTLDDYDKVGEGSFGTTLSQIYSKTAIPGENLDLALLAKDGYYIRAVTVVPAALGVEATYSGAFGRQSGSLVMPAGNIQVNVYFEKGWPDDKKDLDDTVNYDLTLEVHDIPGSGSTANFRSLAGTALTTPESDPVGGGDRKTLKNRAYDDDRVEVALNPVDGYYAASIDVFDSRGHTLPWQYVPGGIGFAMTPAHVTVVVRYEKLPTYDPGNPDDPNYPEMHRVTLYIRGGDSTDQASLTSDGVTIDQNGQYIELPEPPGGQTVTLEARPGPGHSIAAVYAVSASSGEQLLTPMPLVPGGGVVSFAMPRMDDAEVYVIFDDTMAPPADDQRLGTLQVVGPNGSGSAQMTAAVGVKQNTGLVPASGGGSLFAPQNTLLTVGLTVEAGFAIAAIRVTDGQGNRVPYTWTDGAQRQFTLSMPVTGVHVYVEYEDVTHVNRDLTAQVVVNNGGNAGNTAKLRLPGTAVGGGSAWLGGLGPGDVIDLDLVVQPGFKVEYIKVTPVKYGIAPSLYKPATEDQTTSFTMPGEDVVVYVRFKGDDRDRQPVNLVVEGDATDGNKAYIHSDYSGKKGPVTPGHSDSVQAAPPTATLPAEWVTVDYEWADGCSVKSITVVDANGDPVPFTQSTNDPNRKGQLVFPMVDSSVTVTIVYQNDPNPPKYDAVLHVIDLDDPAASNASWGKLTWNGTDTGETHSFTPPRSPEAIAMGLGNGEEVLRVPTGETVTVDADAEAGTYIKAAYVLYRDMGQMISFDFDLPAGGTIGFQGHQTDTFTMHPGRVDVYIYFTKVQPTTNDYAAVLMLDSPNTDTTSTATITNENARPTQIGTATVTANTPPDGHGYVTATDKDTITITVHPATGYVIDSVLMTPLGIAVEQGGTVALTKQPDGSYTFTMPAQNVAVRVKLRRGSSGDYRVTLHYRMWNGDPVADATKDWAMLSFADDSNPARWDTDGEFRMVPELAQVTLGVSVTDPNLVLAAYALQEPGIMVPFTAALEGTTEVVSTPDHNLVDAETTFTMPAADVDVFVWFIDKNDPDMPDVDKWHTAVLVVTDDDGTTGGVVNSGKNSASIKSSTHNPTPTEVFSNGMIKRGTVTGNVSVGDVAEHSYIWVEDGETITVKIETIHEDYSFFRPVTYTRSDVSGTQTPTEDGTNAPNYVYTYTAGDYNTTARAHFTASDVKQSTLNVVVIDRDNPGNGTVTNSVWVSPNGMPALTVNSTTSAGARQRIPNVTASTKVDFKVTPDSGEYTAVIRLLDSGGNLIQTWYNYVDNFSMPNQAATLEVTFFKSRSASLTVWDTRGITTDVDKTAAGKMTESSFGGSVTADTTRVPGTFAYLPDGTVLAASLTELAADTRLIGALLLYPGGSRWLPATSVAGSADEYRYKISGSDVEIRLLVGPINDPDNPDTWDYIASVSAVNLPAGAAAPTIAGPSTPAPAGSWTTAKSGENITVTLDVPYGYRAVLTTTASNNAAVTIAPDAFDGTSGALTGQTASFTMPPANTHVVVRYVKTRFTADIRTAGSGSGTATLSEATSSQSATAPGSIGNLMGGETLDYTATPSADSTLSMVLRRTASGNTTLLGTTGAGSAPMPAEDVTITAIFDKVDETEPDKKHHIAFVTVTGRTDGLPQNSAQAITNQNQSLGDGVIWAYGDQGDDMLTTFTVAPGYKAVVTAKRLDTDTQISIGQQGTTGSATALHTMPDADVEVIITYYRVDDPDPDHPDPIDPPPAPKDRTLSLCLVGHDRLPENTATLTGGAKPLTLAGEDGPIDTTAKLGDPLDLDAARRNDYIIVRATLEYTDPGTGLNTVIDLNLNEYGTTKVGLFTMPDADALVTVYYRLPYEAMLLVIDAQGRDFDGGAAGDTTAATATNVPNTKLEVTNPAGTSMGSTTLTHTKITGLFGDETVTTTVDKKHIADGGTLPDDASIASVVATTSSGTVHLTENTTTSTADTGIYDYQMSDLSATPIRRADDVTVTVILRDDKAEKDLYTATVYKIGHDDLPANSATIRNTTTSGLPTGEVWAGAYDKDLMQVDVGTATGYYAIVTAKRVTGESVYVLQWTTTGSFPAQFTMPAADVDVTVEYVKEKPKADLTLELKGHDEKAENKGTIYNDAAGTPDPDATPPPAVLLTANGAESVPSGGAAGSGADPFSKTAKDVDVGDYLTTVPEHANGYYIKSVTLTAGTFTFDLLNDTTVIPRVPVGGATITIEFAPGKQSGRPYDPEHSERYNAAAVWTGGNYVTGDDDPDKDNPDLTVAPKLGQQGWILAESPDPEAKTVVVTIPTLFDEDTALSDTDALADAGVDPKATPAETPPTYKFYWWDKDNSTYVPFTTADYEVTTEKSLDYTATPNENPKGDFPKPATAGDPQVHHYGYRMTLKAKDGSASPLADYIENGGEIYVTATRPGNVNEAADPKVPWTESLMTQVVIQPETGLRPFDPGREGDARYNDHWIRAENRGDYLIVTVPMLNNKRETTPTSVDGDMHRLQLHLQVKGDDRNSDIVNVTDLLTIQHIKGYQHPNTINTLFDPAWTSTGSYLFEEVYENDLYYEDKPYHDDYLDANGDPYYGARFVVTIKEDASGTNADILRKIFDNDGTMKTATGYRMYITSDVVKTLTDPQPTFRKDDYVDFEVPRYYTLTGTLESYAPTHITTAGLYPFLGTSDPKADGDGYAMEPAFVQKHWEEKGVGLWLTSFSIKSSELMGEDRAGVTYQLVIDKAGHVALPVPDLSLKPATLDPEDPEEVTFTLMAANAAGDILYDEDDPSVEAIALFGGDVNGDGFARMEDYTYLTGYIGGQWKWQAEYFDPLDLILRPNTVTKNLKSIYYPSALPYWADLDGDGRITSSDVAIWNTPRNYNKNTVDYIMPKLRVSGASFAMMLAEELLLDLEELPLLPEETPPEELPGEAEQPQEPEVPGEEELPEIPETPGTDPEEGKTEDGGVTPEEPEDQLPTDPPAGDLVTPDPEEPDPGDPDEAEPQDPEPGPEEPSPEPEGKEPASDTEVDENSPCTEKISSAALDTN